MTLASNCRYWFVIPHWLHETFTYWQTRCLEQLEARNVTLNEQFMPILSRALRIGTQLQILKLENCNLSGRPIIILGEFHVQRCPDLPMLKWCLQSASLLRNYKSYFFFQGPIGREFRTMVRIRWSVVQMCCAMSLVCPSIATHRTCQFWARSELVNMPKTIGSPTKCGELAVIRLLYFRTSDEECCSQVLSFFMTMLGRILQLQQRGSCNVFDGNCLITHHHPPGLGSLWFSSLSSYETVVGGQHFGTMICRPA